MEFYDINLDISFKNDLKHKGINTSLDTLISELSVFHRFVTVNDIKDNILILIQSETSLRHLHIL